MIRSLLLGVALAGSAVGGALAQDVVPPGDVPARDLPANGGTGLRTGNIATTGQTVPHPGASQGAGVTPMDRGIEQEDTKIQSGICKGC